jgi:integrase
MAETAVRQRRRRRQILTDKMVSELPRREAPYFFPDVELPKHGIRIRRNGPGAYTVITRAFGKQKWVKIGSTAEMTIDAARDIARTVIRRVERGEAAFEPPKPKPESFAAVAEQWLKRHVEKNRLRTGAEMRRRVEKYVLPHFGERDFVSIKRRDISELLDVIEDRHGAAMADGVLNVLRSIATWKQSRDDDYVPPFTKKMRRIPKHDRERSRILDDNELRAVWETAGSSGAYGALIKLLLLTAQRRDKVAGMCWGDIAPDGTWTIRTEPGEKQNAGTLLLPKLALEIIHAQPRFVADDHVFAGVNRGGRAFNYTHAKQNFDNRCGVGGWRLHDLRRCARSLMSRAQVRPDIAERVLGHTVGGSVEAVYDRHRYVDEKADALRRLAALIQRIVNPPSGNVVPMHEAAVSS